MDERIDLDNGWTTSQRRRSSRSSQKPGFRLVWNTARITSSFSSLITIDDAYRAVDWRTVFLLAGLIPLGIAMERSGTAGWLAATLTELLVDAPVLLLLVAVAALATFLSLFMSNVAATVLLVPLVAELGAVAEVSPRALGLLVAVCASNSFLLPTHQVNALLMAPGGYRNRDYLRAGSGMTLLFVVVAVGLIFLGYLG